MENKIVEKTKKYLDENFKNELSLNDISKKMNYSKFHLNRVFAEQTGLTIHKYIQKKRLLFAAKRLLESDRPIIDIAFEANYNSQQSFNLAFKQAFHCTPSLYRRINRPLIQEQPFTEKVNLNLYRIEALAA